MARLRDSQRSKVYRWERTQEWFTMSHPPVPRVGDASLRTMMKAARDYVRPGMPLPRLVLPDRHLRYARGRRDRVMLPIWARTPALLLHEFSHAVADDGHAAWHGPEYMGVYISLVAHFLGQDAFRLLETAHKAGVKVADIPHVGRVERISRKTLTLQSALAI